MSPGILYNVNTYEIDKSHRVPLTKYYNILQATFFIHFLHSKYGYVKLIKNKLQKPMKFMKDLIKNIDYNFVKTQEIINFFYKFFCFNVFKINVKIAFSNSFYKTMYFKIVSISLNLS